MRIRLPLLAVLALTLSCDSTLWAASSFPPHQGSSPWSFTTVAEPSSRFIVNDTDSPTIDVYLLRSQGPIVIDVTTRRYVGPTDANGYLLNVAGLRARGIVGDTAAVTLPAFDVDETTPANTDCDSDGVVDTLKSEIDELFLNGEKIGTLSGSNNRWLQNTFSVPIGKVKFPSQPGLTATNRFRLDIDVGNRNVVLSSGAVGCERWAVAIDWIGVKYDASSPVVMVHGILSSGSAFAHFKAGLEARLVMANDNSIRLVDPVAPHPIPPGCPDIPYNRSIQANVAQLRNLVPQIAERFGSETLHFVAHSKGGLDVRGFLSGTRSSPLSIHVGTMGGRPVTRDFEGRSLVTLDTPHSGSVLAQYGVEARQLTSVQAVRTDITAAAAKSYEGAYYCDLTPARATAFIGSTSLPEGVQRGSVAADADCNEDLSISVLAFCGAGQGEPEGFPGGVATANRLYRLIGTVASVTIAVTPRSFLPDEIVVTETPTMSFQVNDAVVSQSSAWLYPRYAITGWHHMNVHSRDNAETVATDAQGGGILDWRKR